MRDDMTEFYVLDWGVVDDTPLFFEADWYPSLPEFNQVVGNPDQNVFSDTYEVKVGLSELCIDVIFEQYMASHEFIRLCEVYKCSFMAVPLKVKLQKNKPIKKNYYFFMVLDRCSLLDHDKSIYEYPDERLLRPVEERKDMIPICDRIDKFVPRSDVDYDLFFCEDIKQMVCSGAFRSGYLENGLTGLEFKKIDDSFVYAPWD